MLKLLVSVFTFFFLTVTQVIAQNDNPYLQWGNKKYSEYCWELREELGKLVYLDSVGGMRIVEQFKEVAKHHNDDNWLLEAELFRIYHSFFRIPVERNEQAVDELILLAEKAQKATNSPIRLRALYIAANRYRNFIKNYELAFECYRTIVKELGDISLDEFPEKSEYYYDIADYYYQFGDYETARHYFQIILENERTSCNERIFIHARNGLGLCSRYFNKDLDESDKWFNSILAMRMNGTEKETIYEQWVGIVNGNLGSNQYLRKEYDKAIPLLHFALDRTLDFNDYGYAAGCAVTLADCYQHTGENAKAKQYLSLAEELFRKAEAGEGSRHLLFKGISRYYIATGNQHLALAYLDSTLSEQDIYNKQFSALQLLRVEQRAGLMEQKVKEEELLLEKIRKEAYRKNLLFVSAGLILTLILLVLYMMLYKKKKVAYQELVRKNIAWANAGEIKDTDPPAKPEKCENSKKETNNSNYKEIMNRFRLFVEVDKLYIKQDITLDFIAGQLHVNRVYLSQAINQETGNNFNTFINELRIKEAVRIMSDKKSVNLSLDGIAYDVGFNDRTSFYRSFKKITGLSPGEFRKNQLP